MSTRYVSRGRSPKKKIHSKDAFELCYLRHKYFRRVKYNPTEKNMEPFNRIVTHIAKNTYFTYQSLFRLVGFEVEDVVNIGNVHIVSFLGLFTLQKMPDKYKEFVKVFSKIEDKKPDPQDVLEKNQANFTLFLKQRMEDVVRVCKQKARNIKGIPYEECQYYYGPNKPPKRIGNLLKDHEKYGFRKLDPAVFKTIKRKAGLVHTSYFDFAGNYYIAISVERRSLQLEDFSGANMDPRDSLHNMSPEDAYVALETAIDWENKKEEFHNKPDDFKAATLRNFIDQNRRNRKLSSEVKTARRQLKRFESCNG